MTVLVGYVPSPEGEAALRAGIDEARRRGENVLVVNTSRGDAYVDPRFAQEPDLAHVREDLAALRISSTSARCSADAMPPMRSSNWRSSRMCPWW